MTVFNAGVELVVPEEKKTEEIGEDEEMKAEDTRHPPLWL